MKAVFKHELRQYFDSMTAYVFGAFLLLFIGIGSMLYNLQSAVSNFEFVLNFASIVFVVIVPVLTMRTLSEERKQKTDQLLYALPISTTQVILGKYAALLLVFLIPLCFVALYPLLFSQFGEVYLPTAYGSLFAFFLQGAQVQVDSRQGRGALQQQQQGGHQGQPEISVLKAYLPVDHIYVPPFSRSSNR